MQLICKKTIKRKGSGLLNKLINKLPFEAHIPGGYRFCGPGTKLNKRLARNDQGINQLDEACKVHDIAYSKFDNLEQRHEADKVLSDKAWERVKSKDSSIGEKLAALGVTAAMKTKVKLGMGVKRKSSGKKRHKKIKNKRTVGKGITFNKALRNANKTLKKNGKGKDVNSAIKMALKEFRKVKKNKKYPRVISFPKTGGFLPLIPIFAGLSALGALAGGASSIASAVNKAKSAQQELKEKQRHNEKMESIAMGKGLFVRPYKKGYGLFVNPYSYYEGKIFFL